MVFLGFGKWARADRIYALEPLEGEDRGHGKRTRVWVDGVPDPIVASRTERTILAEMGQDTSSAMSPLLDDALDLAERLATAVEEGRVDLGDLGRRARRVLERTARPVVLPVTNDMISVVLRREPISRPLDVATRGASGPRCRSGRPDSLPRDDSPRAAEC